jgi:Fe2+ transport system protein FeoA
VCLTEVGRGRTVQVERIDDSQLRAQLIRFGITEGSCIECLERIPFGPLMIRHNRQELALGRAVACGIHVVPPETNP